MTTEKKEPKRRSVKDVKRAKPSKKTKKQSASEFSEDKGPQDEAASPQAAASKAAPTKTAPQKAVSSKDASTKAAAQKDAPSKAASAKTAAPKAARSKAASAASSNRRQKKKLRWVKILTALVLVLGLIAAGLFAWNRWFRFDDAQDILGEWVYQEGDSTVQVFISETDIHLTESVAYSYTIDTTAKTLEYDFGSLQGSGAYRFSSDRNTVVIAEETKGNLMVDLKVSLDMAELLEGFDSEDCIVLERESA